MPCQVRLGGICNGNTETTVLAHYRLAGTCGMGLKPPDLLGAWCCSSCHDVIDGRVKTGEYFKAQIQFWFAEGVLRTINELIKRDVISFGKRGIAE
jgi:hypothetical protein